MLPLINQVQHKDFWANIVLSAEAFQEPFEQVNVVTLRSHFLDAVFEQAFDELMQDGVWSDDLFASKARSIIETNPPHVFEHVVFSPDGAITVVIDIPEIGEDTVFDVMEMLANAMDQPRINNKVRMGQDVVFTTDVLG